MEFINRRITN